MVTFSPCGMTPRITTVPPDRAQSGRLFDRFGDARAFDDYIGAPGQKPRRSRDGRNDVSVRRDSPVAVAPIFRATSRREAWRVERDDPGRAGPAVPIAPREDR